MKVDVKRLLKNYGILFAFFLVCCAVLILRKKRPEAPDGLADWGRPCIFKPDKPCQNRLERFSSKSAALQSRAQLLLRLPRTEFACQVMNNTGLLPLIVDNLVVLNHWLLSGVTHAVCTTPVVGDGLLFFAAWAPGKSDSPFPGWDQFLARYDKNHDGHLDKAEFEQIKLP